MSSGFALENKAVWLLLMDGMSDLTGYALQAVLAHSRCGRVEDGVTSQRLVTFWRCEPRQNNDGALA